MVQGKNMKTLIVLTLLFTNSIISAQETTLDMVMKAKKEISTLNETMTSKIKMFKKTIDIEGQKLFDEEHKAWLKFMKAKVNFSSDKYRGGTLSRVVAGRATVREYKARIKTLNDYIENYNKP